MLVRIAVNVTMTVQPFYLQEVTGYRSWKGCCTSAALALVPLAAFLMQILFTLFLQPGLNRYTKSRLLP